MLIIISVLLTAYILVGVHHTNEFWNALEELEAHANEEEVQKEITRQEWFELDLLRSAMERNIIVAILVNVFLVLAAPVINFRIWLRERSEK